VITDNGACYKSHPWRDALATTGITHKRTLNNPVTDWVAGLDLDNVSFIVVGLFVAVRAAAIAYWRLAKVEHRWTSRPYEADAGQARLPGGTTSAFVCTVPL
jgi:hypothetical protein